MTTETAHDVLVLDAEEADLVAQEVTAFLPALDGARRERYAALAVAVRAREIPNDLLPALESLLEMTLQTARVRQRYRAEGERILTALYRRTPGGRELTRHLGEVNEALRTLAGQTIDGIAVRMRTVGYFTITVSTPGAKVTLSARPDSVDVEAVGVGPA